MVNGYLPIKLIKANYKSNLGKKHAYWLNDQKHG